MSATDVQNTRTLVRAVTILGIAAAVCLVATCISIKAAMNKTVAAVGVTDAGRVLPLVTLDKAYVTEPRLVSFVEECLRRSFEHDFIHYRETTTAAMTCFTPDGASSYAQAISPLLKTMSQERRVMTSTVDRPPVVVRGPYLMNGIAAWDVQAVITLGFEGTKDRVPGTKYRVDVLVTRVDLSESMRGVAVRNFSLSPAQAN